jgi:gas vesicle protein
MNNTAKLIIVAAAGAAIGAALGILFAPAKGDDTRENIWKKGREFADDIANKFGQGNKEKKQEQETFS